MENIKAKDLVTWAILIGILWEVSKQSPAPSAPAYGQIDACCGPCGELLGKNIQQSSQTPYWIAQYGSGSGSRFIYEAN